MSVYLPTKPPESFDRPRDTGLPHPPDGCPRCVAGFAVVPFAVESDRQDSREYPGVYCWYRCPRCRLLWRCAWGVWGSATDTHQWPDCHNESTCPCGCGLPLLRSARPLGGVA